MTRSAFIRLPAGALAVYQGPLDQLDYGIDYSTLLGDDPIVSSDWEGSGDITLARDAIAGAVASVFVTGSGGTVTNTVTSAGGRRKSVSFCVLPMPGAVCG